MSSAQADQTQEREKAREQKSKRKHMWPYWVSRADTGIVTVNA